MGVSPHLPVSVPHDEKLADLFVFLLLPIDPLTSLGTVQGGLASSAVLELEIRRRYGATDDAALGYDCCWSRSSGGGVMQIDPGEAYRSVSILFYASSIFVRMYAVEEASLQNELGSRSGSGSFRTTL
jgi:hypothetical protein